jgi:hypothetical protein
MRGTDIAAADTATGWSVTCAAVTVKTITPENNNKLL